MRQLRVHHDNDNMIESICLSIYPPDHYLFFFSRYEITKVRLDLAGTSGPRNEL